MRALDVDCPLVSIDWNAPICANSLCIIEVVSNRGLIRLRPDVHCKTRIRVTEVILSHQLDGAPLIIRAA